MNDYIKKAVNRKYKFDVHTATQKQLDSVTEINVSDVSMDSDITTWDFSAFKNLKTLDCSYLFIKDLITSSCPNLEYLRWEGVRGREISLDISENKNLKKVRGGQDGIKELDFSNNPLIEEISIMLSQDLRWIELSKCQELKKLTLYGVLIPFVDLTSLHKLEHLDINYMNQYKNMEDEYGEGYPRPILFVNEDFDESIINENTRKYSYYTYKLVRVAKNSKEEAFLDMVKGMKEIALSIPSDRRGVNIAAFHYELLKKYQTILAL